MFISVQYSSYGILNIFVQYSLLLVRSHFGSSHCRDSHHAGCRYAHHVIGVVHRLQRGVFRPFLASSGATLSSRAAATPNADVTAQIPSRLCHSPRPRECQRFLQTKAPNPRKSLRTRPQVAQTPTQRHRQRDRSSYRSHF